VSIDYHLWAYDGNTVTTYDLKSRLQGFDIRQSVGVAKLGRGEARFQLDNYDGALTPNGSGSYANVPWTEMVIWMTGTYDGTISNLFAGFVSDFSLVDNGVVSTVELLCDDPWAIIGRGITENFGIIFPLSGWTDVANFIETLVNFGSVPKTTNGIKMPTLANATAEAEVLDVGLAAHTLFYTRTIASGRIESTISNNVLPASMGVIWPGMWRQNAGVTYYQAYCVGYGLTADNNNGGTVMEYEMTESPTGAAQQLALERLQTGHNLKEIVNAVRIDTPYNGNEYEAVNTTSADKQGERGANWLQHLRAAQAPGFNSGLPVKVTVDLTPYCEAIVNRFGTFRFTARTARTKQSMNTSANALAAFRDLLDMRWGLWAQMNVVYTPTGASSPITDPCVIAKRRISGTPSDVIVQLELLPAQDFQAFQLNGNILGVLNTNRLG
jgi:hypothetical protein